MALMFAKAQAIKQPFFIILLLVGFQKAGTAVTDTTSAVPMNVYDSAMLHLINQDYRSARTILDNHLSRNPSDFRALYLSFANEQTRILDYESYIVDQRRFQIMADSLKRIFETGLTGLRGVDSTACLFYLANVYGGVSVVQAKSGNWFEGVKNAISSVSMLKLVKKRDACFYAADLGLGIFNYYLSTSFKWLPFFEDKQHEGLKAVESALKARFPYNYAAKNSLCWILIERKDFRRADSIAQSVLIEFPNNTIFLRIKALVALWTGRHDEALRLGSTLVALTERRQPPNWSDLVAGYTILVQGNDEAGREREACGAAQKMLTRKIPAEYRQIPHIRKNITYVNGIRRNCRKGKR
ncbi:MAG: hypothetical protein JXA18_12890 [Chitinispirillaceae bacterium]|nr:hypothetical protein [Chitinispirillaceae bacterium]